jgi:hypothetical protein
VVSNPSIETAFGIGIFEPSSVHVYTVDLRITPENEFTVLIDTVLEEDEK